MLPCRLAFSALLVVLGSTVLSPQEPSETLTPRWSKTFKKDYWVVNTSISHEYGLRRNDEQMPRDLGTIDSVDATQSTMLILEGPPDAGATLHAFDADDGSALWQRAGVRLQRWRPFPSYVPGKRVSAYYAQIVGSAVLLWTSNSSNQESGCSTGPQLVALSLRGGQTLWCTREVPQGDVTFVAIPERHMVLAWSAADSGVTLLAFDARTGVTRWRRTLPIYGPDWLRVVSWLTGLPAPEAARPPLHYNGRVPIIASGAKRYGPVLRAPREAAIQMVDLATGDPFWEAVEPLESLQPWLSWTFSDTSFIFTTGKLVVAYDLASGEKRWSTALEDVRSLRVARTREGDVVLVDFDARRVFMPTPTKMGRGLAAIDVTSGKVLWQDARARALHSIDEPPATLLLQDGRDVRAINVVSGAETFRLRPPFEDDVRFARLLRTNRVVVQSATEVAVYEQHSTTPAFQHHVPRALRGIARPIIYGILSPAIQGAVIVAEVASPGVTGLRGKEIRPEQDSKYAFFATGRGKGSRLIVVNVESHTSQVAAPFIWGDSSGFSLGNLLSESHGLVYTLSGKTFAAYAFEIDSAEHTRTHQLADLQRAASMRDRAIAAAALKRADVARSEALAGVATLDRLAGLPAEPGDVRLVAHTTLADCYAILADVSAESDRIKYATEAIAAYEAALALISQSRDASDAWRRREIEEQLATLRRRLMAT